MKLQSFLAESSIEASEVYKEMEKDHDSNVEFFKNGLKAILSHLTGFKYISSELIPINTSKGDVNSYCFYFTNGLTKLRIRFRKRNEKWHTFYTNVYLEDKYLVNAAEKSSPTLESEKMLINLHLMMDENGGSFDGEEIQSLNNAGKILEEFNDWYFDISGRYGKLKLLKTRTDLMSGSHTMSGTTYRWAAFAGDFEFDQEAQSGESTARIIE